MKFVWPVLLVAFRALYFVYSLWCLLFPLAVAWFILHLSRDAALLGLDTRFWIWCLLAALLLFAVVLLALVYQRRSPDDPNPFQSAFMSWFGTLRSFWNAHPGDMVKFGLPSGYLVENPRAYRIGGPDMQQILDRIQPGDILLRGYDGYVDGALIRRASVCSAKGFQAGWFTHAALYVGQLGAADRQRVPQPYQDNPAFFQEGSQMLIHAMAKGVHCQDLLTFCRSDYLVVLRIKPGTTRLDVAATTQAARQSALEKIGTSYDYDASDTTAFNRFSCSQLVYYCLRSVHEALQLAPLAHALYPLSPFNKTFSILKRTTITPDDFYALVQAGSMECVWQDKVSKQRGGRAVKPG